MIYSSTKYKLVMTGHFQILNNFWIVHFLLMVTKMQNTKNLLTWDSWKVLFSSTWNISSIYVRLAFDITCRFWRYASNNLRVVRDILWYKFVQSQNCNWLLWTSIHCFLNKGLFCEHISATTGPWKILVNDTFQWRVRFCYFLNGNRRIRSQYIC